MADPFPFPKASPRPLPIIGVEDDCEDQGFTRLSDGCFACRPDFDAKGKPIRPKIVKRRERGLTVWACVKCGGNYGIVSARLPQGERP